MNRYLLHNLSNNHNEVEAFHYVEDTFQSKKQFHIDDISKYISSDSEIFYFIPSSKISSIKIDATKDDTDETIRARSENEIFIHRNSKLDLAIVINKSYLISLTKKLRSTGSKIFICPEHMLSFLKDEASIFQIADRIIFSLSAGEGFSQNELNLDDYVNLLKQERKNFLPKLYINNSTLVKNFKDSEIKDISLETLHLLFIKEHSILPNLYRSGFQLTLSGLGSNQYQFLINLLPQANLNLITEDVKTSNGKVSGLITIGLSD